MANHPLIPSTFFYPLPPREVKGISQKFKTPLLGKFDHLNLEFVSSACA
jgi:hypothetical protein